MAIGIMSKFELSLTFYSVTNILILFFLKKIGTALIVEWEKVHLKARDASGAVSDSAHGSSPFSFQVCKQRLKTRGFQNIV